VGEVIDPWREYRVVSTEPTERTDLESLSRLMELGDYIIPFALRVSADLGVADRLPDADAEAWAKFDHSVRTGRNAFKHVHGCQYWEYVEEPPEFRARFDASMRGCAAMELRAILPLYDWGQYGTIADLGGGTGGFIAGPLGEHPGMRGVLQVLPSVVATTDTRLALQRRKNATSAWRAANAVPRGEAPAW